MHTCIKGLPGKTEENRGTSERQGSAYLGGGAAHAKAIRAELPAELTFEQGSEGSEEGLC